MEKKKLKAFIIKLGQPNRGFINFYVNDKLYKTINLTKDRTGTVGVILKKNDIISLVAVPTHLSAESKNGFGGLMTPM